jgi:ferredoxin-type protein NapH
MAARAEPAGRRSIHLPVLDVHRPRGGPVRKSTKSRLRTISLILVHVIVLVHIAHWKLTGTTVTPLEPSESMQTLELGYLNAGFVLFAFLILSTMILGRFFCGWACHVVAYQDLAAHLLGRFGIRPRPVRSRLLVLVPFGAAFYMFFWPQVARIVSGGAFPSLVSHFTTDAFWRTFPGPVVAIITLLVDGFLVVYFLGSKGFCTYGCPYGAFFGGVDRLALGKIRVTDDCDQCGHCTATCTSNVRVHEEVAKFRMVVDPGCMKCLDCTSVCPKHALYYGLGRPTFLRSRKKKRKRVYDFSWAEEGVMAVVFLAALLAFRGLYGQVPFLLAVGLGVIAAFGAILGWRLVRRPFVTFQHHPLRIEGRFTRAGATVGILLPIFFLLGLHSGWVQLHSREGERLLLRAERLEPSDQRDRILTASLGHLLEADRWGLIPVGSLELQIGSILREEGRYPEAEARMRRAIEIDPSLRTPRIELAGLLIQREAYAEAEGVLVELLRLDPGNQRAQSWLEGVRERLGEPEPR